MTLYSVTNVKYGVASYASWYTNPDTTTILVTTNPNWYHNLIPTTTLSHIHTSLHTSRHILLYTTSQQYHHNFASNQEHKAVIAVYYAYTTKSHPSDQGNILTKWTPLVSPYKYLHCLPKLHHLHQYTSVNRSTKWSRLTYPPHPLTIQTIDTPLFTNIEICLPFKYQSQLCYYRDGLFIPPKETSQGH
jgi:hypothetical protein